MRRRSRLNQTLQKKTRKTMILSIIGIIIVLFILFKFGISTLISFSLFLSGKGGDAGLNGNQNAINFVAAPVLNPLVPATNSASMIITGLSQKDTKIELFINSRKVDETDTEEDGSFRFEQDLRLGDNVISTRAVVRDKKSDLSNQYTVLYKKTAPKLDISNPSDGASFKKEDKSVEVKGQTDGGATVTVNGFFAVINDDNNFSYVLPLHDGDNEIKIVAEDSAGNRTEKTLKVNYSQ
ncbi:MAG: hypothetical protein HY344_04145 [Candidatus Levybacteria bacterium]|nr:hypothetical protein [Candidatus Levybacteria bacterium]